MRRVPFVVCVAFFAVSLFAQQTTSPLVEAAKRSNRLGKTPTNVITNETVGANTGRISFASNEDNATPEPPKTAGKKAPGAAPANTTPPPAPTPAAPAPVRAAASSPAPATPRPAPPTGGTLRSTVSMSNPQSTAANVTPSSTVTNTTPSSTVRNVAPASTANNITPRSTATSSTPTVVTPAAPPVY